MTHRLLAVAAAAAFTFTAPAPADAGTYKVHGCRTPDGRAIGHEGWAPLGTSAASAPSDDCATGGALRLDLNSNYSHLGGVQMSWVFTAPANTVVAGYRLHRSVSLGGTYGGSNPTAWISYPGNVYGDAKEVSLGNFNSARGTHGEPFHPSNLLADEYGLAGDPTSLYVTVKCGGDNATQCPSRSGPIADARLHAAQVVLRDSIAPSPGVVGGSLVTAGTKAGSESVVFDATDRGAGVYRGIVEVDGAPVHHAVIDANGGRCADAVPADPANDFLDRVPCPTSASADVTVDTSLLDDGEHTLRVRVEDAAGNLATAYGPAKFTTDNVPAPANRNAPQITGSPVVGRTLAADEGVWTGDDLSYAFRWQRCDAGGEGCADVAGATGRLYDVVAADAGRRLRVVVSAVNGEGEASARSAATDAVRDVTVSSGGSSDAPSSGNGSGSAASPTAPNAPAELNGANASERAILTAAFARSSTASYTARFGERVVVRGRLVNEHGRGVGSAKLDLTSRSARPGAAAVDKGGVRTRPDGTWTYIAPKGSTSRTLRFAYRAKLTDRNEVDAKALELGVRAGLRLSGSPRRLRNGKATTFRGRLLGGPVPLAGKLVELQVKLGRGWRTFATARSDRRGSFRYRYRFRRTFRPTRYVFRARARRDASYPYATGTSKAVRVTVR